MNAAPRFKSRCGKRKKCHKAHGHFSPTAVFDPTGKQTWKMDCLKGRDWRMPWRHYKVPPQLFSKRTRPPGAKHDPPPFETLPHLLTKEMA